MTNIGEPTIEAQPPEPIDWDGLDRARQRGFRRLGWMMIALYTLHFTIGPTIFKYGFALGSVAWLTPFLLAGPQPMAMATLYPKFFLGILILGGLSMMTTAPTFGQFLVTGLCVLGIIWFYKAFYRQIDRELNRCETNNAQAKD